MEESFVKGRSKIFGSSLLQVMQEGLSEQLLPPGISSKNSHGTGMGAGIKCVAAILDRLSATRISNIFSKTRAFPTSASTTRHSFPESRTNSLQKKWWGGFRDAWNSGRER